MWPAIAGAVGGAALSIGADWMGNQLIGKPNANDAYRQSRKGAKYAFEKSYKAYRHRYQDTMADMRKAGLNPIMAASGGFNVGSSPQMKPATGFQSVPRGYQSPSTSARDLQETSTSAAKEQETVRKIQKIRAETLNALEQIKQTRAARKLLTQQERQAFQQVQNLEKDYWIKIMQFKKLTQEAYQSVTQTSIVKKQEKLLTLQLKELTYALQQLSKTAEVYSGPAGNVIKYIREIMRALNINLGAFITPGRGKK